MEIQLMLINKYGEFLGQRAELTEENYKKLLQMVREFYINGGFELTLEDGNFVVFPPDIVKDSILKIIKL